MSWVWHPRSRVAHFLVDGRTLCERFNQGTKKPLKEVAESFVGPRCSVCRRRCAERDPTAAVFLWIYAGRDFCRGCGMMIEWWLTPNRLVPINPQNWRAPRPQEIRQLTGIRHEWMLERCHLNTCTAAVLFIGCGAGRSSSVVAAEAHCERRIGP